MVMAPPSTASAGARKLGGRQDDALWTRVLLAMVDLLVGGTQWVVLSAADEHPWCGASRAGPGRGVDGADGAIQPLVTVLSQLLTQRALRSVPSVSCDFVSSYTEVGLGVSVPMCVESVDS